jgi:hypothetical protein
MKSLCLLFAFAAFVSAQEPAKNIQIDVDYIEVSEPVLTELQRGPKPPASGKEWRVALDKLIKEEKAKVMEGIGITTRAGTRATAESVREVPYATEFDPAKGRAANSPEVPREITGVDVPPPTAFEVKPLGARCEVDPILGADGKTVDLTIAPELSYKVGEVVHQEIQKGTEMLATIKQPEFYSAKLATSVSVRDGSSTLLGILLPKNEEGDVDPSRRILCIASVRLMAVE